MNRSVLVAPSLLSADFTRLAEQVRLCEQGGADLLHLDIMDGRFVPNITFGQPVVAAIRRSTTLVLDCHLMIIEPERYVQSFVEAGANWISVHVEACAHLHRTLQTIRSLGARAGIVLNPLTPLEYAFEAAEYADYVLIMSVDPGFGGQQFIPSSLRRIERLRQWLDRHDLAVPIEVDGGVSAENAADIAQAGANILVSGAAIFNGSIESNVATLRQKAMAARA